MVYSRYIQCLVDCMGEYDLRSGENSVGISRKIIEKHDLTSVSRFLIHLRVHISTDWLVIC